MKNEIINDWKPETASLLASLRKHGFVITGGSNGEDTVSRPTGTVDQLRFLGELLACDEAWLYVRRNAKKDSVKTPGKRVFCVYCLYLVLGNSPGELVSDWGIPNDEEDAKALELACSECSDQWEGQAQPKEKSPY